MEKISLLSGYQVDPGVWDEMFESKGIRNGYKKLVSAIESLSNEELSHKIELAKKLFMSQGITFTVYSSGEGIEKIFPFDIIPRVIQAEEWKVIEAGIKQRIKTLNIFLNDIYHNQFIVKDGIIPLRLIYSCSGFVRAMVNVKVPHEIYTHIAGIDLIRDEEGHFFVLEDNLRTPSGVSYMLENRSITYRIFPDLLPKNKVRSIKDYPDLLLNNLVSLANRQTSNPTVVLLTPGIFNSAYFEHTTLARLMGIELVEGKDLVVDDHKVYMKTTNGLKQVDVIYRRVDDEFIDPLLFRRDTLLGVPGLYGAYRMGQVAVVNAIGNGVADDKAIYSYVPNMIKYYLNEDPILKNVPTYPMEVTEYREMVFGNMAKMVIKKTNESGGYGMLIGNAATEQQMQDFKNAISADPRSFIAQPIINLSSVPCYINGTLQARRVDLRPYALYGPQGIDIVPGGLTRVALREGSLVVNSSQGGGSKDTWVINE
ncbi:MAG: circularly permuted type 2 ATP-grasp protein [Saprospiraceae bacterium]|nr:circularly permuted type 2 ATP-grasp protein [Saprospiraceae bacterium]